MHNLSTQSGSITSRDVARRADVSVGTVMRVLRKDGGVTDALRERVQRAIDELGYIHVPRKTRGVEHGNGVKRHDTLRTVSFCVPITRNPHVQDAYFYQTLRGAQSECASRQISVVYTTYEDTPRALPEIKQAVQRGLADGLILINYGSRQLIEGLLELDVPLVLIDPHQPVGLPVDSVIYDALDGVLLAMQHLIDLGHREIAFINGPQQRYTMQRRLEGYRTALATAGIPFRAELVVNGDTTPEGGQREMQQLLAAGHRFTAVLCANDYTAFGAIQALNAAGLRVPEDVSVVGFDDIDAAKLVSPPLTTIHADLEGKGSVAIGRLLERTTRSGGPFVRSVVQVHLIERASTAPPKAQR